MAPEPDEVALAALPEALLAELLALLTTLESPLEALATLVLMLLICAEIELRTEASAVCATELRLAISLLAFEATLENSATAADVALEKAPAAPDVTVEKAPAAPLVTVEITPPAPLVTVETTPPAPDLIVDTTPPAPLVTVEYAPAAPLVAVLYAPPTTLVAVSRAPPTALVAVVKAPPISEPTELTMLPRFCADATVRRATTGRIWKRILKFLKRCECEMCSWIFSRRSKLGLCEVEEVGCSGVSEIIVRESRN